MALKPGNLGAWQDIHATHKSQFKEKIGAYHIYRCSCGSKFFVTEADHGHGRIAPGIEKP